MTRQEGDSKKGRGIAVVTFGVAGVSLWVGLFAAGMLIDSKPYRDAFAPDRGRAEQTLEVADAETDGAMQRVALDGDRLPAVSGRPISTLPSARRTMYPPDLRTFGKATLFFTPLNTALLALLAALVGGCASWLAHRDDKVADSASPEERARLERRLPFLQESPLTAMLRGFAVYLAVIAGVYITGGDPFQDGSPSQYVRFAGTVSLLAYLVGYDPTRLQDLLDGMPRLTKKG
jgi:hypothetical protein